MFIFYNGSYSQKDLPPGSVYVSPSIQIHIDRHPKGLLVHWGIYDAKDIADALMAAVTDTVESYLQSTIVGYEVQEDSDTHFLMQSDDGFTIRT